MAFCGDNIRMRISGVSDRDITPGFVLTSVQKPVKAVTAFRADISFIDTKNIICPGYSCVLHVHTLAEEVTVTVRTSARYRVSPLTVTTVIPQLLRKEDQKKVQEAPTVRQGWYACLCRH